VHPLTLESLYARHHRALLGFCRHALQRRDAADAAFEQTFVRAAAALRAGAAPPDVRVWLFTVARNRCWEAPTLRTVLALADFGELSSAQFARVLAQAEPQAKVLAYRARRELAGELARPGPRCEDVRIELSVSGGPPPGRALRRHLRRCQGCRAFSAEVDRQRAQLAATAPLATDALRSRVMEAATQALLVSP
jgi:hypothetical protein